MFPPLSLDHRSLCPIIIIDTCLNETLHIKLTLSPRTRGNQTCVCGLFMQSHPIVDTAVLHHSGTRRAQQFVTAFPDSQPHRGRLSSERLIYTEE